MSGRTPRSIGLVDKVRTEDNMVTADMIRHSGERRNPAISISYWIPAFAGKTG